MSSQGFRFSPRNASGFRHQLRAPRIEPRSSRRLIEASHTGSPPKASSHLLSERPIEICELSQAKCLPSFGISSPAMGFSSA